MVKISINIQTGTVDSPAESATIVGIDLGTTHSLVAYIKDGLPVTIKDKCGNNSLIPSIVYIPENGPVEVGLSAKEKLVGAPLRTLYSVKRLMGKSYNDVRHHQDSFSYKIIDDNDESLVKIQVGDRFYSPIELSAEILKCLKRMAEIQLKRTVHQAVITVPAYFNDAQRQATRDAGKLAGLDVLRIINEPTAAALAYDIGTNRSDHKRIAVYDLGGGTFDISILELNEGIFEVLSTHGDTYLGGDDFDRVIQEHWTTNNPKLDKLQENDPGFRTQLRLEAENAKKHLNESDHFEAEVGSQTLLLDRATFEKLITPLIQRTIESCRKCLADSGLGKKDLDHIILVGGSTRLKMVKKMVHDFFGKEVNDRIHPDETVALGAAVQADILAGNRKDMLLLDITPLSLGIETIGGLMDTIIPRNSKVPTRAGRQYTTSVDGQKNLKIAVYQGERDLVNDNRKLGEFILKNIPPMAAGIPKIDIQFVIDADGILKVKASELRSNVETEVQIKSQYGISEEEMARMLQTSILNAQKDMEVRALIEAQTEAKNLLLHSQKFIEQNTAWLSGEDRSLLEKHMKLLRAVLDSEDKNKINRYMEDLNRISRPLAEKAMDHTIASALKGKNV